MILILLLPLVLVIIITAIYRWFNPLPHYPITDKLKHCVIGHRAAPIIAHGSDNINHHNEQQKTDDHTKGVFDENGFIIPENSLPSFELAYKSGIKTVEVDIQYTKDGQCVVFHDQVIGNTLLCPSDNYKQLGIKDFAYNDLKKMKFLTTCHQSTDNSDKITVNDNNPYSNASVALLSEVLSFCKDKNMNIMIEVKPQPNLYNCIKSITTLVEEYKMVDNVYIASFTPLACIFTRLCSTQICFGFLFSPTASSIAKSELIRQKIQIPLFLQYSIICWLFDSILLTLGQPFFLWLFGASIVIPHYSYVSQYTKMSYENKGITLLCYTVNDPTCQDFIYNQAGVSIITDHPQAEMVQCGSDVKFGLKAKGE
jgi:glycerophosphoryl diester phosphodiesterase